MSTPHRKSNIAAIISLLVLSVVICLTKAESQEEFQILVDFFQSTDGFEWKNNKNWLVGTNYCSWNGVYCAYGAVNSLQLSGNNLRGVIPESLGRLSNLYTLNLSDNQLTGAIPEGLTKAVRLQNVNLSKNKLDKLPAGIANLKALLYLDLSRNSFSGFVPTSLANLPLLNTLDLSHNRFSGTFALDFGNLYAKFQLRKLNLSNNLITKLSDLPMPAPFLEFCDMSSNKFGCPIPKWTAFKCNTTCFTH